MSVTESFSFCASYPCIELYLECWWIVKSFNFVSLYWIAHSLYMSLHWITRHLYILELNCPLPSLYWFSVNGKVILSPTTDGGWWHWSLRSGKKLCQIVCRLRRKWGHEPRHDCTAAAACKYVPTNCSRHKEMKSHPADRWPFLSHHDVAGDDWAAYQIGADL